MDFNEYQKLSKGTAVFNKETAPYYLYLTLGLVGESGEVADKIKKVLRDSNGNFSREKKEEIALELGDVLWYLSQFADELGFSLEEIALMNRQKLESRKMRNKLHGKGDAR